MTVGLAVVGLVTAGCAADRDPPAGSAADRSPDPAPGAVEPAPPADAPLAVPDVEIDGTRLLLVDPDGTHTEAAVLDPSEELLHAVVRPGDHGPITVLVLTRSADRYELRYLNVVDEEISDLYWFPWRLQVTEDVVTIADVPTLPVWAPDGTALAWLEWDADGTRLRTVGWIDHGETGNPSDDQAAYRITEVPAGAQLVGWEHDADGTPVLRAHGDGRDVWRIRLEGDLPVVALEGSPGATAGRGSGL